MRSAAALVIALIAAGVCSALLYAVCIRLAARIHMTARQQCRVLTTATFIPPLVAAVTFGRTMHGAEIPGGGMTGISLLLHAAPSLFVRIASILLRTAIFAAFVYACGVLLQLLRVARSWFVARAMVESAGECTDGSVRDIVRETARLMECRPAAVRSANHIDSPAVVGAINPRILIPRDITRRMTTDQLRSVIAHELAHIQRRDPLWNSIQLVVDASMFFSPFHRRISTELRAQRELACDADAAARCGPVILARALERLETARTSRTHPLALAASDKPLLRRIIALAQPDTIPSSRFAVAGTVALLMLTGMIVCAFVPAGVADDAVLAASPAAAMHQTITAQDDAGPFTVKVDYFRATAATFGGTAFPRERIRQRGRTVRFTSPTGSTLLSVELRPTGGMTWRSR